MANRETVRPNSTLNGDTQQNDKQSQPTEKNRIGFLNADQKSIVYFLKGRYTISDTARYMLPVLLNRYTLLAKVEAGNENLKPELETADKSIKYIIGNAEGYRRVGLNGLNNAVKRLEATFSSDESEISPAVAVANTLKQIIDEGADNKLSQSPKAKS